VSIKSWLTVAPARAADTFSWDDDDYTINCA
jgi:hypothetical protein